MIFLEVIDAKITNNLAASFHFRTEIEICEQQTTLGFNANKKIVKLYLEESEILNINLDEFNLLKINTKV